MPEFWDIEYYISPAGQDPVRDFINSLEERSWSKVVRALQLLVEFGVTVHNPHTKKLVGVPFWELCIVGADNIRIFYIAKSGRTFLILHGFKKKGQKTDTKEIQTALNRLKEYFARKYS